MASGKSGTQRGPHYNKPAPNHLKMVETFHRRKIVRARCDAREIALELTELRENR